MNTDWVYFYDNAVSFPDEKWKLGRWLGPSVDIGPAMTAKILQANGKPVHRSTYRALNEQELVDPVEIAKWKEFDESIRAKLGDGLTWEDLPDDVETPQYPLYSDESGEVHSHCPDVDEVTPDTGADNYIGASVNLSFNGKRQTGKVKGRKRDRDGNLMGTKNQNPILDTRRYEVEFPNGEVAEFSANVIAENMWAQCDVEGRQHLLLDAIVGHRKLDTAVAVADGTVVDRYGRKSPKKTTKGWDLCVKWKDETTSWVKLSDLKESNPVEVAEYAVAQGISQEPAFAWWAPFTLKKRDRIIAAVNKRYFKRTHK